MSHYDKKFENESQDARRNDRHDTVHPDDKLLRNKDKTTVRAEHKDKPKDPEK